LEENFTGAGEIGLSHRGRSSFFEKKSRDENRRGTESEEKKKTTPRLGKKEAEDGPVLGSKKKGVKGGDCHRLVVRKIRRSPHRPRTGQLNLTKKKGHGVRRRGRQASEAISANKGNLNLGVANGDKRRCEKGTFDSISERGTATFETGGEARTKWANLDTTIEGRRNSKGRADIS